DLAAAAGADAAVLQRVLRSLVTLGVLPAAPHDRFALTEMRQYLQSDRPDSIQPRAILNTGLLLPLWGDLLHTLRTGESGVARVRENIAAAGLSDRCTAVGGSALETVPAGGDAYIFSNFLIGMDDKRAIEVLRRCHRAMTDGGRVLLIEWVVPARGEMTDSFK